jgi:hypothetical protein
MTIQQDFLGIKELKGLSSRESMELHEALEDLVTQDPEVHLRALDCLVGMDAHLRSALAVSFLAHRLVERDHRVRIRIVGLIADTLEASRRAERPPAKVRQLLHNVLSNMGEREVFSLLQLVAGENDLLEPVCTILDQCSFSGDILLNILNHREFDIDIRIAAAEAIATIGFLEAQQSIEALEKRLENRARGQLSMAFAPRSVEEAEQLIPVLRRTLDALLEASI